MIGVKQGTVPLVLGLPHTETGLPGDIAASLNETGLASADTDWTIHHLHDGLAPGASWARTEHGFAVPYDCHSIGNRIPSLFSGVLTDLNIGDDEGRGGASSLTSGIAAICSASPGYSTTVNGRFKSGFTICHHGRPHESIHAIQIELVPTYYGRAAALALSARKGRRAAHFPSGHSKLYLALETSMKFSRKNHRDVYPPTGPNITARSWLTEAPMRMLMNNLHPDVAENPNELVVYGGIGRAARSWQDFDRIITTLKDLRADETLLVQSGRPVGVFKTHEDAPRVLIANSNLVPRWANWEHFNALDRKGLAMYGQMTAGSWIYIGTQGIVQGTYETFAEAGRQHYGGQLKGKWILTGGLGGMGGAQPLAAVFAGACCLAVECDPDRIEARLRTHYLDEKTDDLDQALAMIERWTKAGEAKSVGLLGNAADVFTELAGRGTRPDLVTDQTSAHDPVNGYLPIGWTMVQWREKRESDPKAVEAASRPSMRAHVEAMVAFHNRGVPTLDYGNNIRQVALEEGFAEAFAFPGFVPACIRPLFCRGIGPFRWVALSGDEQDIYKTDQKVKELIPDDRHLHHWLDMARERISFQGLPARICWVGLGQRHRLGLAFNEMVKNGEVSAPIVIGRDHLDSGSVASPNRETEAMKDGSDAVSDWPLLNALLNTASGATWVSIHHGGGVGMGFSQHAGMVICADGSEAASARLRRVLWNDPASGVMRHADAGYELALDCAKRYNLNLPGLI